MSDLYINKYLVITTSMIIMLGNTLLDHFFAPAGILLSPIFTTIAVATIYLTKANFDVLFKSLLIYALIAIGDIGLKLYGGGMHDSEGQGVLNLFLFISTIPCFILLLIFTIRNNNIPLIKKIVSISLFFTLIFLHLWFFGEIGLGRYYPIKYNFTL